MPQVIIKTTHYLRHPQDVSVKQRWKKGDIRNKSKKNEKAAFSRYFLIDCLNFLDIELFLSL